MTMHTWRRHSNTWYTCGNAVGMDARLGRCLFDKIALFSGVFFTEHLDGDPSVKRILTHAIDGRERSLADAHRV